MKQKLQTIFEKLKNQSKIEKLVLFLFTSICIFLTISFHNKIPELHYRAEIWADKAGYYIYLPATFIYGYEPTNYPESIDKQTGEGFFLKYEDHKVQTKYTCGQAILMTPFFLVTHFIASAFDLEPTGFSKIYHDSINIAALFYLILGLFFIYKFLKNYFNYFAALISVFLIFIATNLYWYSIIETFMSHVFSFFLFSAFLYFSKQFIDNENKRTRYFIILSVLLSLIILIRPTNFIIGFILLFIDIKHFTEFKQRILNLLKFKYFALFLITFLIVIFPQLLYWKYLTGSFISYSYGDEGFIYWKNPKILEVLFYPGNSLFLFTPIWIFILISIFSFIFKNKWLGISIFSIFLLVIYLSASWHSWSFGCSYGMRPMVEYLVIFAIPITFIIEKILSFRNKILKFSILLILVYFSYFNVKMCYGYDGCFYGEKWDWKEYYNYIDKNKLLGFTTKSYTYFNDFEDINCNKFTQ